MSVGTEAHGVALPQVSPSASLSLVKPADSLATTPSTAEWVLPGLIPKNQVTLLSGPGGGYKSLWAIQVAYSLAAGSPVMGIPSKGRIPVIFISCEDKEAELRRRLGRWSRHVGIKAESEDEEDIPLFIIPRVTKSAFLCKRNKEGRIVPGDFYPLLCNVLARMPGSLVILDPVSHFWFGNENSPTQVTEFVGDCLGSLIRGYGCTILAVNCTWNAPGAPYPGSKALYDAFPNHLWIEPDAAHRTWFYEGKRRAMVPGERAATQLEWKNGIFV